MPIFIPDLFTSYINGRRQAVQDNWTDLQNYNTVLGGQMENALGMQIMGDRARISAANAEVAGQNAALGAATTDRDIDLIQKQNALGLNDLVANAMYAQYMHQQRMYNDPQYRADFMRYYNANGGTGTGTGGGVGDPNMRPMGSEKPQGQGTTGAGQPSSVPGQQGGNVGQSNSGTGQLVQQADGSWADNAGNKYTYNQSLGRFVQVR